MPSDDLVLNVRQISQYAPATNAFGTDNLLIQRTGLGGPYLSIDAAILVGSALSAGGSMAIGGPLTAQSVSGGSAQFSNGAFNVLSATKAAIANLNVSAGGTVLGVPIATVADIAALAAASVRSFEGRVGDVCLWLQDIVRAGGAPLWSPVFSGEPRAPTPSPWSNSSRLATTGFVHRNSVEYIQHLLVDHPFVFTFNGRSGDVVLTEEDIINAGGGDIFDSPIFTGVPIAPTAATGTDTDQVATTAFVNAEIAASTLFAPLDSPQFTGFPSAPTAPAGSSTGQLATTAFVENAITEATAGVASFNTRTGAVILTIGDVTGAGGAPSASPTFTGTPQGPTAAPGTNNTQLATTAFVEAAIGGVGVETFNGRAGAVTLTTADVTGAGGAPIASAALTGVPTAPTAAASTSTTQLATTAFVMAALATGGVTSFNTRSGTVTLLASDISAAGGATLVSPVFTGVPIAPTAAPTVTTNQIATCAFVAAAIAGSVASFNGRTGAVTLTAADISAAGGAPLASPALTGTPTAPTAAPGANSTQLATTAFVLAAIGSATGVTTFNGRAGAVTLSAADISAAGGAPLTSPTFTGTPQGPTAAASTSTTQLATTAFVMNAISAGGGVLSFNGRAGAVTLSSADLAAATVVPTVQLFAAPGPITYTPPAGVKYLRVRMVAGGGGGGGAVGGLVGAAGGTTSFGGWTCIGGAGGGGGGAVGGSPGLGGVGGGGGADGVGTKIVRFVGCYGGLGQAVATQPALTLFPIGGAGGSTPFGGGMAVVRAAGVVPPTGVGGAGAFSNNVSVTGAGGGGGGEYVEFFAAPATVTGAVGAAGAGGTGGVVGGAGSQGIVIVEEYYS